ncbi:acyltransferase [Terribacillus sp. 179-K 1B1 HS]|uniref:acyltransferase family protein n=1 Tax=Terribacillus sp. 179-K 1B1 HS TaxID=3142388 RepID=UPI00399F8BF7
MRRITELDALRGIAALAVVFYHYTTRYSELFPDSHHSNLNFVLGHFGVNLFFIVSGFVIFMSIRNNSSSKDFVVKRAIRLYPAYIFAVIFTFICVMLYGLEERRVSMLEGVLNLTMFQGFIPGIDHVDGVYWTLVVELTFYAVITILIFTKLINKIETIAIIWLMFSAAIKTVNILVANNIVQLLDTYSISSYAHLFIAGMMFYKIWQGASKYHYFVLLSALVYDYVFFDLANNLVTSVFFLLFMLMLNGNLAFLSVKPLLFLGTISYSLYLIHQNIGYIIIDFMYRHDLTSDFVLILPVGVSIMLSAIVTFYIEQPIQRYLSSKLKRQPLVTKKTVTEIKGKIPQL